MHYNRLLVTKGKLHEQSVEKKQTLKYEIVTMNT